MFNKNILILMLIMGTLISACAPAQLAKPTAQPFPKLIGEWTVKMTQSGGIMGLQRTIEIHSDGKAHIENQRGDKQSVDRKLSAEQLKQLTNLVSSSKLITSDKPNGACADCFIYDLQITSNGQTFSKQLNDVSLPDSGLAPLVEFLRQLMDTALA